MQWLLHVTSRDMKWVMSDSQALHGILSLWIKVSASITQRQEQVKASLSLSWVSQTHLLGLPSPLFGGPWQKTQKLMCPIVTGRFWWSTQNLWPISSIVRCVGCSVELALLTRAKLLLEHPDLTACGAVESFQLVIAWLMRSCLFLRILSATRSSALWACSVRIRRECGHGSLRMWSVLRSPSNVNRWSVLQLGAKCQKIFKCMLKHVSAQKTTINICSTRSLKISWPLSQPGTRKIAAFQRPQQKVSWGKAIRSRGRKEIFRSFTLLMDSGLFQMAVPCVCNALQLRETKKEAIWHVVMWA